MLRLLRLWLFILGGFGRKWLISESGCWLDCIELCSLGLLLIVRTCAIAELLPRQVVPYVYGSLLLLLC